ncbi:hypothetical protein N9Q08_05110, partial [Schleiferiaceae bacterium]|nr:hypothetical protein [Schleiferiaceae bacterium]
RILDRLLEIRGIEDKKANNQIPELNIPWDVHEFLSYAGTADIWNQNILLEQSVFSTEKEQKHPRYYGIFLTQLFASWPSLVIDAIKVKKVFLTFILRGSIPLKSSFLSIIDKTFIPNREVRLDLYEYMLTGGVAKEKALLISRSIPIVYLEGFQYYFKIFGCRRRKLVTSFAHFSNYKFHYLSAFHESTSVIIYEHGTESLNKWNDYFDFEIGIANRLYGLSRELIETNQYRWYKHLKFSKTKAGPINRILMVTVNMPKFTLDKRSMPCGDDFQSYMSSVHALGMLLATKTPVIHRPYFKKEGWNDTDLTKFGPWLKDTRSMKFVLNEYQLFVITYPGSMWLDLIQRGKVIILVWDYFQYPLRDHSLEEILVQNGILFKDSIDLQEKLSGILNNPLKYGKRSSELIRKYFE